MTKTSQSRLKSTSLSAPSIINDGEMHMMGRRRSKYAKPELIRLGRIDQLTQGSGGSCVDGVQADKALTGDGKCP